MPTGFPNPTTSQIPFHAEPTHSYAPVVQNLAAVAAAFALVALAVPLPTLTRTEEADE